jgi:hypothetical protein
MAFEINYLKILEKKASSYIFSISYKKNQIDNHLYIHLYLTNSL